jgi:uncharacterized circularly permuted ATP-grasp superfamily protein
MNSTATWWCGQTKELTYVLNNLPKLIIKKTNRDLGFKSVYGRKLSKNNWQILQFLSNPKVCGTGRSKFVYNALANRWKILPRLAVIRAFLISDGTNTK